MVKYKIAIQFDKDFLNKLKNETDSGVEIHNTEHHIALHPVQLNSFNESVKDLLSDGIAKYNKKLDGILLGYQNIKLLSNEGYIHDDSYYIHLDLRADFFIFKPEIDKIMQGIVNRISKDHVGLLVYNAFNVSIPKPKTDSNWLGTAVALGQKVQFKITYINLSSCMPFIKGELLSIPSEVGEGKIAHLTKKSKKHKKLKTVIENTPEIKSENNHHDAGSEANTEHKKSKRKKKEKQEEISLQEFNLSEMFNTSGQKKVKKKKLKDKEDEINILSEPKIHKKRKRSESESGSPEKKLRKSSVQVKQEM